MPNLEEVRKRIDSISKSKKESLEWKREYNSASARNKRAAVIEEVLKKFVSPEVQQLLALTDRIIRYRYIVNRGRYDGADITADLYVYSDGLRASNLKGSWWKNICSPRQVAMHMAGLEVGVDPMVLENILEDQLPKY